MEILTVQLPEKEIKLFKQLLKKFNATIVSQTSIPNADTIEAMNEVKSGKGVKFSSVEELFNSI